MRCVCVGDKRNGFIVENDKNVGVFSVNMQGNTRMGSGSTADLSIGKWTGFGHHSQTGKSRCAISQTDKGETILNAAKGQGVSLRTDNTEVARVIGTQFDVSNTGQTANATSFNASGSNHITCGPNGNTYFKAGKNGWTARCDKNGFYAGSYHVANELRALKTTVQNLEGQMAHRLDMRKTIKLYNHATKKYSGKDGRPNAPKYDSNAHYSIHYD